jgi:beta-1,4-N-acetylglucosaminyltransferase
MQPIKVGLVGSSGGHLLQLLILKEWWSDHERFWVTFPKMDAIHALQSENRYWCYHPTNRHIVNLLRNLLLAWKIVRRERPKVIISTGAAVAVPFFYIGKLHGAKTIYLEVFDRINSPTLTGRFVYPVADLFLVQWEEQKRYYPKAHVVGELL